MRQGWTRNTLKVGDAVTVEGSAAKDGTNVGNARRRRRSMPRVSACLPHRVRRRRPVSSAERGFQEDAVRHASDWRSRLRDRDWVHDVLGVAAQPPAPQSGALAGRGRGGPIRSAAADAAASPTAPSNLGRVAGEQGVWNVPCITNMGERVVEEDGDDVERHPPRRSRARCAGARRRHALGGGEGTSVAAAAGRSPSPRCRSSRGPRPFYDYNSTNQSEAYDPEGYCLRPAVRA